MSAILYPKSPTNLPKNLTSLPSSYKFKAFLAILAILLFFILYFALVFALGYLVYYSFIYKITNINKFTTLLKIGAISGSFMLFVFTLKFIFKLKNHRPENRIKLKKEEHKTLWEFVKKICKETGAPKPKNIYIDPDVNAYVSYSNIWLSLFLPIKKELTVGLGIVNCLNLSEFKAVIAHEFGHFAQSSMKIGSYINSANTIIHDMIYARDKWDEILDKWRASDIRLSVAAWIITPIIWLIRVTLGLFYRFLNIMYSSLSREMEFNADKVAVSTTGSEAIISALWKLDNGFEKWNNTLNNAFLASKKKVFVKNLYVHNNLALERSHKEQSEKLNNLPKDNRGRKKFFLSSEVSKANMYGSHPPNDKREHNAKAPFITCEEDNRSPWLIFNNNEKLQEEMTSLIHKQYLNKTPSSFSKTDVFENFIKKEQQGNELTKEYLNTFKNRFLHIDDDSILYKKMESFTEASSKTIIALKKELSSLMKPIQEIEALMDKAVKISEGTTKETSFSFNKKEYKKKNIQEGFDNLILERERLFNDKFKDWDTQFCTTHLFLAKENGKDKELLKIYNQHRKICLIYKEFVTTKNTIINDLNEIQARTEIQQNEVTSFENRVKDIHFNLNDTLTKIDAIEFVPLTNIDNSKELKEAIVDGGKFERKTGSIFENGEFNNIISELEMAIMNCQRIDQKSITSILLYHKNLTLN